jgi:hypothetical protein
MTVTIVVTSEGYLAEVSGAGYNDRGQLHLHKCDNLERAREAMTNLLEVSHLSSFLSIKRRGVNRDDWKRRVICPLRPINCNSVDLHLT